MPRPRATPEQRDEQRQRIRRAAAEIYAEDGVSGVSVRSIATRAGISQGTIYSYFSNLSDLMRSLWLEPVAKVNQQFEQIAGEVEDPVERLRVLLNAYLDFAISHTDVYRGALMYVRPASTPVPEPSPVDDVSFFRLLAEALGEAQRDGQLDIKDPRLSAELLWAGLHGAIALPVNTEIYAVSSSERLASAMVDLLMTAIGA